MEPEPPYEGFFYRLDHLKAMGDQPTPTAVKRELPKGELRELTFKKLMEEHPERVDYLVEYVEARGYNGVYDQLEIQECLDLITKGEAMPEKGASHKKLAKLRTGFLSQLEELEDLEEGPERDGPTLGQRQRSGDWDGILEDFAGLRESVKPIGIIGGDEERSMWGYWGVAVEIHLDRREVERALQLQEEYEEARMAVGLKPLPSYCVQEKIIGYLAQIDIGRARAQLQDWLAKSKMHGVPDVIKHHNDFADLFPQNE